MLVILRENVQNLGRIGDVVKVTDGYARNFLLPRNLVVAAAEGNLQEIEHHQRSLEKKRKAQQSVYEDLAKRITEFSCTISRKVGEHDKIFGSVTTGDITDTLNKAGIAIEKRSIKLGQPIKTLGVHTVTVHLDANLEANLKVWVVKEE